MMDNFSKENYTMADERIKEMEETISDLQRTIDLLLKERQSICPYPFKYASEMPEWFKKGFEE